jgi:hypothetical protein
MYLQYRRKNKYGNRKSEYNGIIYDSGKECDRAIELDILKKAKGIKDWRRQVTLPLFFGDYRICNYRIDFVVTENDGKIVLEEVKGFPTYEWTLKRNMLEAILDSPKREELQKIFDVLGIKNKDTEVEYHVIK